MLSGLGSNAEKEAGTIDNIGALYGIRYLRLLHSQGHVKMFFAGACQFNEAADMCNITTLLKSLELF